MAQPRCRLALFGAQAARPLLARSSLGALSDMSADAFCNSTTAPPAPHARIYQSHFLETEEFRGVRGKFEDPSAGCFHMGPMLLNAMASMTAMDAILEEVLSFIATIASMANIALEAR